jgi:hypothetical protein
MSVAQEFDTFVRRYWTCANEERDAYGQPYIGLDAYKTVNEEWLLDEWHRHKFDE